MPRSDGACCGSRDAVLLGYNVLYTASCYASGLSADRFPKHWVLASGYALAVVPAIALLTSGDSFAKFGVVFGVPVSTWASAALQTPM